MDGAPWTVTAPDGVELGLLTAGAGPPLLLVHGGMGRLERWEPMWPRLTAHWRVTAMDRRGRGSSADGPKYTPTTEPGDITAVAARLAGEYDDPIDVFAHSIGATFTLQAAAAANSFRRLALYEPPDRAPWPEAGRTPSTP